MSYSNVGKVWTADSLAAYLKTLKVPSWAKKVCVHHSAFPDLAMRPKGFLMQHIENIKWGYVNDKKWSSGPHFFVDEDQSYGMTPPTEKGVHAVGFNSNAIGLEALGDFDTEDPKSGRGLEVMKMTALTVKYLLDWLGLPVNSTTVVFHREDGYTNKTCPGKKITKEWFLGLVNEAGKTSPKETDEQTIFAIHPASRMVRVADALREKGYNEAEISKNLVNKGNLFFWKQDWLEGAYYDAKIGATVVSQKEIDDIPAKP